MVVLLTSNIMNQYTKFTNKVGMAIFNLKVKDLNRLIKFKQIYTLYSCCVPIFGVNNIARNKFASIYPTFAFYLKRMCFGALNNLTVYIQLNKFVYLIDGSRNNSLLCRFAGYMVNARNNFANLNVFYSLFTKRGQNCRAGNKVPLPQLLRLYYIT